MGNNQEIELAKENEYDFCQYIISKCRFITTGAATGKIIATTKQYIDAYESSACFCGSARLRNRRIINAVSAAIEEENEGGIPFDNDARRVYSRSKKEISIADTYDQILKAISDFLWVKASKLSCESNLISLTDDPISERNLISSWILELKKEIENAQYDLNCMEESKKLPFGKRIFLGLVENKDVAWYANSENISYDELNHRISDCKRYIETKQLIYFAIIATAIVEEDLRRRYR